MSDCKRRRAKKPLNAKAVAQANQIQPNARNYSERKRWMDAYIAAGGAWECVDPAKKKVGSPVVPCNTIYQEIEGKILSVTWKSGIKVSKGKQLIKGPHWKKGENVNDDDDCSIRAAVYLINKSQKGNQDVDVQIEIKSLNISGNAKLTGSIGNLSIEGECKKTSTGIHNVTAKIKELPDSISWNKGDIQWGLEVPAINRTIIMKNRTRVEVFTILDTPGSFYKKGVWVEALRFLCNKKVNIINEKEVPEVFKKITEYCHTSHGLKYDTLSGESLYVSSKYGGALGGTFKLDNYIKASLKTVNCYDQAGAIQALSGALGIKAIWCFQCLQPKIFGFIKKTNLIGVGDCNNPFFKSNGSKEIVPDNDPERTSFSNHAFCKLESKIFDACAGPHLGTENAKQYLDSSVDYKETKRRNEIAGIASDILYQDIDKEVTGITKVV